MERKPKSQPRKKKQAGKCISAPLGKPIKLAAVRDGEFTITRVAGGKIYLHDGNERVVVARAAKK